jgi:hypothetical protein
METVTVTIGRNVQDLPLPDSEWIDFVTRTRASVAEITDELFAVAPYRGSWNGAGEDAYVIYGALPDVPTDQRDSLVSVLRTSLGTLATIYGQDAIGLSVGTSELVPSLVDADVAGEQP